MAEVPVVPKFRRVSTHIHHSGLVHGVIKTLQKWHFIELDRASEVDCGPGGRGFESRRSPLLEALLLGVSTRRSRRRVPAVSPSGTGGRHLPPPPRRLGSCRLPETRSDRHPRSRAATVPFRRPLASLSRGFLLAGGDVTGWLLSGGLRPRHPRNGQALLLAWR